MPDEVTTAWWKEERGERIFIDFNQANRDRTMAGAYSPRPLPHAPVSCPLKWDELECADPRTSRSAPCPTGCTTSATRGLACSRSPDASTLLLEWWQRDLDDGLGELPFPPDFPKMPGEPPRVHPAGLATPSEGSDPDLERGRRLAGGAYLPGAVAPCGRRARPRCERRPSAGRAARPAPAVVLVVDLVLEARPEVHRDRPDLHLDGDVVRSRGEEHRHLHDQVQALVAVLLRLGDVVLDRMTRTSSCAVSSSEIRYASETKLQVSRGRPRCR